MMNIMNNNQRRQEQPTQPPRTPEDTDALLSRELLALSVQERTQALNEIHGVEDIPLHENLHIINQALQLLHIAITQLLLRDSDSTTTSTDHEHNNPQDFSSTGSNGNSNNKPTYAYRLALKQNRSYVESRFLRLAFLRAENLGNSNGGGGGWEKELLQRELQMKRGNGSQNQQQNLIIPISIQKTADRIMNFFTLKLKLWGIDLLTRNIALDDMNDGDKHCLYKGYMTLLPERDRAGRAVIVCLASLIVGCTAQNVNRSFYYVLQCALEDIETQRRGVVCIGYNIDRQSSSFSKDIEKIESEALEFNSRIMKYFYFRMTAMQVVYNDPRIRPLMGFVVYWIGQRIRARFRAHFSVGHIEGQYTLMTFGIPAYCLPIDSSGVINLYYHLEWLQKRQIQEQQQAQAQAQQMLSSVSQRQNQQEQVSSSPLELQFSSSSKKRSSKEGTTSSIMVCNGTATTGITSNGSSINGSHNNASAAAVLASSATTIQNGISNTHRNSITSNSNSNSNTSNDEHQKDDDDSNNNSREEENRQRKKRRKTIFQVPGPDDVLVGRGKLANRHIGNKKYNQLVEQYFDQYNASTRFEKTIVAEIIVKTIQENYNGKFLKLGDEGWIEIDDSDARSKVAHTFRNFRRKPTNKKGGEKKQDGCGTSNTNKSTLANGTSTATKNNISNIKNGGTAKVSPKHQQQQQLSSRLLTLPPVRSSGEEVEGGGGGTTPVAPSFLPPMDPLSGTFLSCLDNNNNGDGCTPTGCLPAICLNGYDIGAVGGTWMDGTRQPRMM